MLVVELDRPGPFRPVLDPVFTVINAEEATPSLPNRTRNRQKNGIHIQVFTSAEC